MRVIVTGSAGFIGFFTAARLLARGDDVIGVDILNDYYDVTLKEARLKQLQQNASYVHERIDISNRSEMDRVFRQYRPDRVVHLAAQAGVRYSLERPQTYVDSNVTGFLNVLENVRNFGTEHLVYASTSSVYGSHTGMPFSVHDNTDHPVSLYAATKKANELMAHTYSHLFGTPCTGVRFFTVYGPWGRPDMALFKFTRSMLAGEPIDLFNHGHHTRDFTYVDDIVEGVIRILDRPAQPDPHWDSDRPDPQSSRAPWRLYNIGSNRPATLLRYVEVLEHELGIKAKFNLLPLQPGDVPDTFADVNDLVRDTGYRPETTIEVGIRRFVDWYKDYYGVRVRGQGTE